MKKRKPVVLLIMPLWLVLLASLLAACQASPATLPPQKTQSDPAIAGATLTLTPQPPTDTPQSAASITLTLQPTSTRTFTPTPLPSFQFAVNGDPAYHAGEREMDTPQFFRGMVEHMAGLGNLDFLITVGDTDPPWAAHWTINRYLGQDFLWFPLVGNHELYPAAMEWLRRYRYDPNGSHPPNIVNPGPEGCAETTFSFDYANSHFVMLNIYCDAGNDMRTDGAIVDHLYNWLKQDLENTSQQHIFVFGHEPAFPQPDADAGVSRHVGDSLDQYPITRDRFWALLKEQGVVAYVTGHTHSYSVVDLDGVWQIDAAHSMGARTQSTRSTYIVITVAGGQVSYTTYRVNNLTDAYEETDNGVLR